MVKREGEIRIPSGCAIAAVTDRSGAVFGGTDIIDSIALMHDRSNGLGGGFAAYGIYPEYKDLYAFHIFYDNNDARVQTESFLFRHFDIETFEQIPTRKVKSITDSPLIWRYFGVVPQSKIKKNDFFILDSAQKGKIKISFSQLNKIATHYVILVKQPFAYKKSKKKIKINKTIIFIPFLSIIESSLLLLSSSYLQKNDRHTTIKSFLFYPIRINSLLFYIVSFSHLFKTF